MQQLGPPPPRSVRSHGAGHHTWDDEDEAADWEALEVVTSLLDGYGMTGDDAIDVTRSFRAALHGFVSLEAAGGFGLPADVNRSFDRLIHNLVRAITDWRVPS